MNTSSGPLIFPPLIDKSPVWFSPVVPTYNESENIEPLVKQIAHVLDQGYTNKYEIIFVDDNSLDGTAMKVASLAERFPQVKLLLRENERGLAAAVMRGWQIAEGEILGVIDGDLQHPVTILPELLAKIKEVSDLALASRYTKDGRVGDWGLARKFTSQCATMLCRLLLPETTFAVSDPMSGCFAIHRTVIENDLLEPEGYKILLEVLVRGRTKNIAEITYTFQPRLHGKTKVTWKQYTDYLKQLIKLRIFLWSLPKSG